MKVTEGRRKTAAFEKETNAVVADYRWDFEVQASLDFRSALCVEFCLFGDFPIQSKLHQKWPEHSDAPSEEPKP